MLLAAPSRRADGCRIGRRHRLSLPIRRLSRRISQGLRASAPALWKSVSSAPGAGSSRRSRPVLTYSHDMAATLARTYVGGDLPRQHIDRPSCAAPSTSSFASTRDPDDGHGAMTEALAATGAPRRDRCSARTAASPCRAKVNGDEVRYVDQRVTSATRSACGCSRRRVSTSSRRIHEPTTASASTAYSAQPMLFEPDGNSLIWLVLRASTTRRQHDDIMAIRIGSAVAASNSDVRQLRRSRAKAA